MAKMKNELAVGLLFVGAMILLGYFTILMREEIFDTRSYYYINVYFPNSEGIAEKSKVRILGVESGIVQRVSLEDNRVKLVCKLYNKCTMYENYTVKIVSESALGGRAVAITPGCPEFGGQYYAAIDITRPLSGTAVADALTMAGMIMDENRASLQESISNLRDVSANLAVVTAKLSNGEGTIGRLLTQDKMYQDADDLVKELRESVEDAREQAPVTSFIRAALTAF